ncbi:peptidoglycan editing factor PgeF [Gorillibacterium massiliense]|uniref:peptidoglycan editing factor PgeF n=1 Tax=Gorillibacterium massiliense TaxID=1280390 RepID=UPI0004B33AEF|nr:peptidoglycan editing factor PgeF [Gorillibacterium massiliense]
MEPFSFQRVEGGPDLFRICGWESRIPGLSVGFTSRLGGVSQESFASLNCGLHVADDPDSVVANRRRVAEEIGIPLEGWVFGEQVHGKRVAVITAQDAGRGAFNRSSALPEADAFITREPRLVLAALFADCVPLFFADPVTGVIGLAHAGWKGTALAIAAETVAAMVNHFGVQPENLLAAIGPSIGSCCYEVDNRVIDEIDRVLDLSASDKDNGERFPYYQKTIAGKYDLDLQQVNRQIMIKAGIMPSSIELSRYCTSCSTDLFYSHRKEKGITGRMMAWIGKAVHA